MIVFRQTNEHLKVIPSFLFEKGSLAYKVVMEDSIKTCNKNSTREFQFSDSSVVASTLLGSVVIFVRLTRLGFA